MQVHHKTVNRLLLRSIGEFLDIALQLVTFKARVHRMVVVSEGAVARTLFQEILGPGLLFALRRRTADLPLPQVNDCSTVFKDQTVQRNVFWGMILPPGATFGLVTEMK